MKNFLLGVLFTLFFGLLAAFAYIRLGFIEVRADIPATRSKLLCSGPLIALLFVGTPQKFQTLCSQQTKLCLPEARSI